MKKLVLAAVILPAVLLGGCYYEDSTPYNWQDLADENRKGYNEGYAEGESAGYEAGREHGYEVGYNEGYSQACLDYGIDP